MPKKPPSKRLDELFDNIGEEEILPALPKGQKAAESPAEKKSRSTAGKSPAKPPARTVPLVQTGALPQTEPLALTPPSGAGMPAIMSLGFKMDSQSWASIQLVDENAERNWSQNDEALVKQVADQLSQALENAQLFQETERRAAELTILNELGQTLSSQFQFEEIVDTIYAGLSRLMNTRNFYVALYEPKTNEIVFPRNITDSEVDRAISRMPMGQGITAHIISAGESVLIGDGTDHWFEERGLEPVGDPAKSFLGVPLIRGRQVLGAMAVQDFAQYNLYDEHSMQLLTAFANQASNAIENARLFQETRTHADELAVLNELTAKLSSQLDVNQVMQEIYRGVSRLLDAKNFYIGLYLPEKNEVTLPLVVSESVIDSQIHTIRADQGLTGHIIRTRAPLVIPRNVKETMDEMGIEIVGDPAMSWLGVPLQSGDQVIGVMAVQSYTEPDVYNEHARDLLMAFAGQAAIAMQNARLFEETERRAAELTILNEMGRELTTQVDVEEIAATVYKYTSQLMDTTNLFISLYDDAKQELNPFFVINDNQRVFSARRPLGKGLSDYILRMRETLFIPEDVPSQMMKLGIEAMFLANTTDMAQCWLGAPLMVGETPIGVICVQSITTPNLYTERHRDLLIAVAGRTAVAIENARLFETTQRSEAELRALFLAMTDVIIIYNREGRYVRIAPTNPSRLFRPPEYMLGKTIQEVLPEPMHQPFMETIHRALESGHLERIEYPLTIEGNQYWFEANVSKLTQDQVFWVARDITARKKNEEEIRKFKLGIDQSSNAVFITDTDGTITYVNPGFEKIYGYPSAEALGKTPRIIKSGLITQEGYQQFWSTLLNKQTVTGEIINRAKDGHLVSIAGTNSPILSESGEILGFLAVHHDISELKQAEETLKRRNEYLSATAEIGHLVTSTLDMPTLFSRTVNLVRERFGFYHAGIFVTEETGFNAVIRAATGEAGAEMMQRQHSLPVGSKSVVGQATETGQAVVINDTLASQIHKYNPLLPDTRAEAAIPLRVGSRTIGALDIQSTQVNAFSEDDIAVLQSLADQVAIAIDNAKSYELSMQAVKEMREADRLKSQFLANMSHELRTPLNSIIGFSRVILKGIDGPTTDLQQQDLLAIHNSGQHLLGLINDILDLSRIEAGKMELTFDEVNLSELITSVMSTVTGLVKDKPIALHREVPPDLPPVRGDTMRLRQVLLNLLSNAAKFTDEGDITVRAILQESSAGHPEIMVRVTDTGPGISAEDQKKLFQPFSQVDASPTRKTGGSGLGLSISSHLIQLHGGRIGVESEVSQGSTFFFTIPALRGTTDIVKDQSGSKVILAIEDDPQVISLYERYLQPQAYQVVPLTDPSRAVDRARSLKPFAITLDIMMPGYDGWRVLTELKSNPETRDIPVVICSIVEDQEKGFSLGAADYLVKPILEDDLLGALDRLNADGSIQEVLIIDDDPNDLRLLDQMVSEHGHYRTIPIAGGLRGWDAIQARTPQAVILDLFMPDLDGFTIVERMRSTEALREIPILLVTGGDLTNAQKAALKEFGQRMLQKSSLDGQRLVATLERALKHVKG